MIRVVLDTNVLVAAARASRSASRQIVNACLEGRVGAVVSCALQREYDLILGRALRGTSYLKQLSRLIEMSQRVEPKSVPRVVPDDPDDDKLVALAIAAKVDALVTSDKHLKSLGLAGNILILSPGETLTQSVLAESMMRPSVSPKQ